MKHDMLRSIRDLDLRSRSRIGLSRSSNVSFDSSGRGEHNGAIIIHLTLTRAAPGGGRLDAPPPLRFFANSSKMAARSAAIFGIPVRTFFPHIV